jgi:NADPH-dependent ferric siderophore reductase
MTVAAQQIPVYRTFLVQVTAVRRLSPAFVRVTFTGPDLGECAPSGFDQRIKLLFPLPEHGLTPCPTGPDWYGEWRALPEERRNPMRTYTVRAARPAARELDVDLVLHGATGPASAWAERAAVGDEVVLVGPNARFDGPRGGVEWQLPADPSCLLLAGDETAVPAICAITESLPAGTRARVLLEVPTDDDALPLAAPTGTEITWLPRTPGTPHGSPLTAAVRAVDGLGSQPYVWLAGEAGTVTALRRHLVREAGVDRAAVTFLGYWRRGAAGG